ncbi:MAG: ion transporter [Thermoanaerobaculales bacterium]|jgi:hypothetical protein|nr:ion transporter [Thermoanaerobaculales bacterium]
MRIWTATKELAGHIGDLPRRSKLRLVWDVFMVWVAAVNLWMILFDLSYLWLRPLYFTHLRVVTRVYDPVKGIEPHPLTEAVLAEIAATEAELARDLDSPAVPQHVERLRELTVRLVQENPFDRSGLERASELVRDRLARRIGRSGSALVDPSVLREAVDAFWTGDPTELSLRIRDLDPRVRHDLGLNYYRTYGPGGRPTDRFWILDLPFLALFWVEFTVRWTHAIRRRTYARWFFFPIFNWYDVLGLIPVAVFRPFRLLRAVSMYMRLSRSELSNVGKDVFTRTVLYFSNIITEEVSDRVALRILSEFAEEVADGTHGRITRAVIEPRKREIEAVLASQIRQTLTDPQITARLRALVQLNLENAVESSEALRAVPLPGFVLRPAVRAIGEVILDATVETVSGTLDSPEGERALEAVAAAVLDDLFYGPGLAEVEGLVREITLQVLDHMKDVVRVRKWALPDDAERRPPMPWEPGALDTTDPEGATGRHRDADSHATEEP